MLKEKNACPSASSNTFSSTLEKSGFSRNSTPFIAPGREQEAITITINRKKSIGISILDAFSIPLRTPRTTTMWVSRIKPTAHKVGRIGSAEKVWK